MCYLALFRRKDIKNRSVTRKKFEKEGVPEIISTILKFKERKELSNTHIIDSLQIVHYQ